MRRLLHRMSGPVHLLHIALPCSAFPTRAGPLKAACQEEAGGQGEGRKSKIFCLLSLPAWEILIPTRQACFGYGFCQGPPASALVLPSPLSASPAFGRYLLPDVVNFRTVSPSLIGLLSSPITPVTKSLECIPCLKSTVVFLGLIGLRLMG